MTFVHFCLTLSCEQHDGYLCLDNQQGHEDRQEHLYLQPGVLRPAARPVSSLHHPGQAQQTVPLPPARNILQVGKNKIHLQSWVTKLISIHLNGSFPKTRLGVD